MMLGSRHRKKTKVVDLVYVDSTLFFSPKQEYIDEILIKLKVQDLDLYVKEEVAGFLSIHPSKKKDRATKLTQVGLADISMLSLGIKWDKLVGNATPP
jgi:hypothetical protein